MEKFKYWLLGSGIVVIAVGLMCVPFSASPKAATSAFNVIAGTGGFLTFFTGILLIVGVLLIVISSFIKSS